MSLEAPRCATLPCASCSSTFTRGTVCRRTVGLPSLCPLSCRLTVYSTSGCCCHASLLLEQLERCCSACCSAVSGHKGSNSVKQQAARSSDCCQQAAGSPKGTSVSVSLGEASIDTLPLYSKYIYNFGITRVLDAQPHASSPLKSLLYLYAKITNTSSVMAIFTHILYFTAVQKKVCNLSKTHCVS